MIGLLVILVISWLLLRFIQNEKLDVLGIIPSVNRLLQFIIGFLFMSIIIFSYVYIETVILEAHWEFTQVSWNLVFDAFVYHLRSALTEDLVFRGALLYILIKRLGANYGILFSAIVFGIYHWFSYGILEERWMLLAYIFIITGFTGYVWAYSFYKTKSIMLALGFHLGYNLTMSFFFEAQPFGELFASQVFKIDLEGWPEFYFSMFRGLFPTIVTLIFLNLLLKTRLFDYSKNKINDQVQ
ncbi:MAG: CPBP family intramembrane glutamic endopeptidase [bacterium]